MPEPHNDFIFSIIGEEFGLVGCTVVIGLFLILIFQGLNVAAKAKDKYGRLLAWVFVDGELLQKKLAQEGLVEKFYDYGYDYTYSELIINADKEARVENRGIYSQN